MKFELFDVRIKFGTNTVCNFNRALAQRSGDLIKFYGPTAKARERLKCFTENS